MQSRKGAVTTPQKGKKMNTYYIDDISNWYNEVKAVEAESVQDALRQCFPNEKLKRDTTNTGNIVVRVPYMTRYGRAYRSYVYCHADAVLWTVHTKK